MSNEEPFSTRPTRGNHSNRSWLERIAQAFSGEPQDRAQLIDILRDAHERNLFDNQALAMIEGVFRVSDEQVRDIMVPRSQMVVVHQEDTLQSIIKVITPSGHSRFPVIEESKDEVVGVLLAKDLLQFVGDKQSEFNIRDILRPSVFIPESKRLNTLLNEFRSSRNHMAIVVDEYGGVAGLVTIEDVLEEIVGDIDDEHDIEEDINIREQSGNRYIVSALTELDEFNQFFKTHLDDDESDTIGGYIMRKLGRLPKRGELFVNDDFEFKVLGSDSRRLYRLQVSRLSPEALDR